jgi:transcriptional repressor NrdR
MVAKAVEYTIVVSSIGGGTTSCGQGSSVRCPYCSSDESKVVDSRDSEAGDATRRRRECLACERRYTTYERVEEVPLMVAKRDGGLEVFSRRKLLNGLEGAVDDIESDLRRVSCRRVTTQLVGERALHHLRAVDKVAYVRFASVYKQFDDIEEFQHELARLELTGADPLPGEDPLPGLEAEVAAFTMNVLGQPPQAAGDGGNEGHE